MSVFNKSKDRDRLGRPFPHWQHGLPSRLGKHVHHVDNHPMFSDDFFMNYGVNPSWWNRLFSTRPRRNDDRLKLILILRGMDPDGLVWLNNKKPKSYYY